MTFFGQKQMDIVISRYLSSLVLGQSQEFRNVGVVPLLNSHDQGLEYLTLSEALAINYLTVTETCHNGSGPRFHLANRSPIPVLALEGEELRRERHTRAFTKTILFQEESET